MIKAAALALGVLLAGSAASAAQCRLALAIGMDVSGSVDTIEYRLQLDGLAGALLNPDVQAQILQTPSHPIWLSAFEWAGQGNQRLLAGWTALDSPEALARVASRLRSTKRVEGANATAIGGAMRFAEQLFVQRPDCWEYTLDLSGDGTNNEGVQPERVRRDLKGRNINGLVVALDLTVGRDERQMEMMELSAYFRTRIIQGPRSFIEIAQGFGDFERAMTRKLLRETETVVVGAR